MELVMAFPRFSRNCAAAQNGWKELCQVVGWEKKSSADDSLRVWKSGVEYSGLNNSLGLSREVGEA